ncbi:unnamed protein product [Effrenium voratum]|uniref:Uncharacterized protein n=1 Tax=Effrenium voratum TaxID=2562239 RepID=A0AA36INF6_9DINO|nr:unnamed protein product [Effrenium voratum]
MSHGVSKRKRTSEALWAKGLRMTSLEAARRSLGASAPETALREAKEVADAARGSGDHLLLAEAVSLQALCLLSSPVEAQQLLEAELGKARGAGHRPAELLLLGAASSAALARSDASSAKRAAAEGLELGRKLGSAFQAENRKPLQQLLLALANAELVLGHCPEAAAATCEALAKSSDESAEGEALHVACLMQMFFGRSAANKALAAAAKGVPPLSSLESCNRAATLFRKLGNQEGEACALLGIAEARSDSQVEALGAARRALDLFRSLRHRRGRLAALQLAASAQKETLAQLDTTEEELRLFEAENDTAGQVAALRILGDFYISAGIYGEARSAFRKSLALLKGLDACETEVQHLLLLSQVEELMGAHEAAERAAQSALALAKRAPSASAELPAARRAASRLAAAQGRAPEAPNRQMALEELRQLTDAARRRDGEAFRKTMARLEDLSGYTEEDVKSALVLEEEHRKGLATFLKQQGQHVSASSKRGEALAKGLSHATLYLFFRLGGLGYGPRFRRCHAYAVEGDSEQAYAVAYLRHLSSQEEWTKNLEYQPPMLDSMQHSLNAIFMT